MPERRPARGADGRALQGRHQPPRHSACAWPAAPSSAARWRTHDPRALDTLYKVLDDWFPGARAHEPGAALEGCAADAARRPAGARRQRRCDGVWLNLGHGSSGWALACGSARALAQTMAGREAPIEPRRPGRSSDCADTLDGRRDGPCNASTPSPPTGRCFDVAQHAAHRSRGAGRAAAAHADAARRRGGGAAGAGAGAACAAHLDRRAARATTAATGSKRRSTCSAPGKQCRGACSATPSRPPADARDALQRARAAGVAIDPARADGAATAGPGDRRPARHRRTAACPAAALRAAIERPGNALRLPGAGGRPALGPRRRHRPAARRAACAPTHTLSLLTLKPGLFTAHGRDQAGDGLVRRAGRRHRRRVAAAPGSAARSAAARAAPPPRAAQGQLRRRGRRRWRARHGRRRAAGRARGACRRRRARLRRAARRARAAASTSLRPELMLRRGWTARAATDA